MSKQLRPGADYIGISMPFYCNDGSGHFLVHRRGEQARDERGRWDFGGGKLDFGEEVEDGVLREVKEEYGVKGEIQEQLPAHSILRKQNGVNTHWLVTPFFVRVDIKKARIMEPNKFSELRIVTLDNLPRPFHTGAQKSMKKYREIFEKYRK